MVALSVPGRAQTTEAVRTTAEERLRIATRVASIGIWEWDVVRNTMDYSAIAKAIYGFEPDGVVTFEQVRNATHPDDLPETHAMAARALDPNVKEQAVFRYRIIRADTGEIRWVLAYGEAEFGEVDGVVRATRYTGTIQDITDQKLAEQALIESEARLRLAIEAGEMAIWEVDMQTGALTGSPELNRLCGFPRDANPTAADIRARHAPGEQERLTREAEAMAARGDTQIQTQFHQIWPNGTEKWLMVRAQIMPNANGVGKRAIGVIIDITEQKRAEERLATVAQELRHRVKNSITLIGALASRTLAGAKDLDRALLDFGGRLQAIAAASDLMLSKPDEVSSLAALVDAIVAPYRNQEFDQFAITGDDIDIPGKVSTGIAMALHELCTNAVKYGALSIPEGRVTITWRLTEAGVLHLEWIERDGPPVAPPDRPGFGSTLLRRGLFSSPDSVEVAFDPSGVRCVMQIAL